MASELPHLARMRKRRFRRLFVEVVLVNVILFRILGFVAERDSAVFKAQQGDLDAFVPELQQLRVPDGLVPGGKL